MKRVQIIHKTLGVSMWVTEAEVEKFVAAGHKLAAAPSETPTEEVKEPEVEEPKKVAKPTKKRK